jgi:hypothetical protein
MSQPPEPKAVAEPYEVTELEPIEADAADLREEAGLFAADLDFARFAAGAVGRRFLAALPEPWQGEHLVIDAMLTWLAPGVRMGSLAWTHEPFPGVTQGVRGRSNAAQGAEHLALVVGPAGVDFLVGPAADQERSVPGKAELLPRHLRLEAALRAGQLERRSIRPGRAYRYAWGCFHRFQPAPRGGFAFWIRATRGDDRPLVNGVRNAVNL